MKVVIAADHNGVLLKSRLADWLTARGHLVADIGTHKAEVVDYPPLCAEVGRRVGSGHDDLGIVIGGSGQGEVIACNKIRGVRAGLAYSRFAVEISRGNNDANVIVLGTKVLTDDECEQLLELWLETPFKGGVHAGRVAQIGALEGRD